MEKRASWEREDERRSFVWNERRRWPRPWRRRRRRRGGGGGWGIGRTVGGMWEGYGQGEKVMFVGPAVGVWCFVATGHEARGVPPVPRRRRRYRRVRGRGRDVWYRRTADVGRGGGGNAAAAVGLWEGFPSLSTAAYPSLRVAPMHRATGTTTSESHGMLVPRVRSLSQINITRLKKQHL